MKGRSERISDIIALMQRAHAAHWPIPKQVTNLGTDSGIAFVHMQTDFGRVRLELATNGFSVARIQNGKTTLRGDDLPVLFRSRRDVTYSSFKTWARARERRREQG